MAIYNYTAEAGENLWKAYASVRSQVNPAIRIQRWKFGIKTEKQAEREEAALMRECQAEVVRRESQGATWGALVEAWNEFEKTQGQNLSELSRQDYVGAMKKHTSSWWKRPSASITRADVMEVLSQLRAQDYSRSNQKTVKVVVNRIFTFGIDHRLVKGLDQSPAFGIELGREVEKEPEILNIDEIRKFLSEARRLKHPWYPVWALALLTGMRNGELFSLLWSDVDWVNKEILVSKSYNCRTREIKPFPKSSCWRVVPISAELSAILKALQESCKVAGDDRPEVLPRLPRWENGEQAEITRMFCSGAGLPSVKFHTLRACFATQLIRNGVPPIQIQKICGWKNLKTMQIYVRLAGIEISGATESLKVLPDNGVVELAAGLFGGKRKKVGGRAA